LPNSIPLFQHLLGAFLSHKKTTANCRGFI
jgi:hypothetical protein